MDALERFHHKFGKWYEGLFGESTTPELRPRDVLRKILSAMEDNRSEGFDGKTYVPNKYILELRVTDPDERDYLLSFLDEEELAAVLQRYMSQNRYHVRGPLDFTITEGDGDEKLAVRVRFERGAKTAAPVSPPSAAPIINEPARNEEFPTVAAARGFEEDATVAASSLVAWAALAVTEADGKRSLVTITKPVFTIGRSRHTDNDLVLANDGQCSKVHSRIEREVDGRATVYDLNSTNGTFVNTNRVAGNTTIKDGDEILIGVTRLLFQQEDQGRAPVAAPRRKAYLVAQGDGAKHALASETLIGRGVTCDIVLDDSQVAMKQSQIFGSSDQVYYIEDLAGKNTTLVCGRSLYRGERLRLSSEDVVQLGATLFKFVEVAIDDL